MYSVMHMNSSSRGQLLTNPALFNIPIFLLFFSIAFFSLIIIELSRDLYPFNNRVFEKIENQSWVIYLCEFVFVFVYRYIEHIITNFNSIFFNFNSFTHIQYYNFSEFISYIFNFIFSLLLDGSILSDGFMHDVGWKKKRK